MSSSWQDGEGKWHRIYGKMKIRKQQRRASAKLREDARLERKAEEKKMLEAAKRAPAKLVS